MTAAEPYHQRTNHTPESVRAQARPLDWAHQPPSARLYSDHAATPLPIDLATLAMPAFQAMDASVPTAGEQVPELAAIARLCRLSNGITRHLRMRDGSQMAFRAAACTGALYHLELYLVCADLPDLPAGVYHYGAPDHTLRLLRAGDARAAVLEASGGEATLAHAPLIVALTSTFWRNAWKYGARAYRHVYWDGGTLLANLLAVCTAQGLPARVVMGYADAPLNALLGVDGQREAVVSLVAVGHTDRPVPPAPVLPTLEPLGPPMAGEVRYAEIEAIHAASALPDGPAAAAWRQRSVPVDELAVLDSPPADAAPPDGIEAVIRRRGSTRQFAAEPISREQLALLLRQALLPIPFDVSVPAATPYLIVNDVADLDPGTYAAHASNGAVALQPLRAGRFREHAGALALQQALGAEAAVCLYFLIDLAPVLDRYGDRGYRLAQLDAAIRAGRVYLAAYALRLGASGLTFYDDLVVRFFSPDAAGQSVLFLLAIGHPVRRRTA